MAAGLISQDDFEEVMGQFLAFSESIRDDWELKTNKEGEKYMVKKCFLSFEERSEKANMKETSVETTNKCLVSDYESLTRECQGKSSVMHLSGEVTSVVPGSSDVVALEYHVVYSKSYAVPVLYFNAHRSDGHLLKLEELWEMVPSPFHDRLQHDRWTFISQQEHPLLGRPFFLLHPCHTKDMMAPALTLQENCQSRNYIVTWLSCVGPVVGLNLSLAYGNMVT